MEMHDRPGYPRWLAVLLTFLLVALVAAFAYNFGIAQGVAQSGAVVAAPATPGAVAPMVYDYPRHWGWGFGFFPFAPLLFFFLFFGVIRRLLWGPRWYRRGYGYGCGPYGYYDRVPPEFDEWHRRAHGQQTPPSATTTQL